MDQIDTRDTITFNLRTSETATNDTLRIDATVHAAITPQTDDKMLKTKVGELTQALLPADWQSSNLVRSVHPSGVETVQITVTARVKVSEASHLEERAQQVKIQSDGCSFNISKIQTDNSFPTWLVDAIESRLRIAMLIKAEKECELINQTLGTGLSYHVARIEFEPNDQYESLSASNGRYAMSGSTYASSRKRPSGGSFDDDGGLGNNQKVMMTAQIVLSR